MVCVVVIQVTLVRKLLQGIGDSLKSMLCISDALNDVCGDLGGKRVCECVCEAVQTACEVLQLCIK